MGTYCIHQTTPAENPQSFSNFTHRFKLKSARPTISTGYAAGKLISLSRKLFRNDDDGSSFETLGSHSDYLIVFF